MSNLLTVGELSRKLGTPVHRIEHFLRSRNIRPVARAGNSRVFSEADLVTLSKIISELDAAKAARHERTSEATTV
jgi:DNA-binding transcriptional MerR regulator